MKEVAAADITALVSQLYQEANFVLPADVVACLRGALGREESPLGREILQTLLDNAEAAARERVPLCQDTGIAVVFVELGQGVQITGGPLREAVDAGIARATAEGYLRASVVDDPVFERKNTKDNTPAVLHVESVPGREIKITVLPKGAGSENMSRVAMLKPADGLAGLLDFIAGAVEAAGANPCPPIFLGVGIGGSMDRAAQLSKQALLRPAGSAHHEPAYAELEEEILDRVNSLGIGPGGLGGTVTCLGVAIEHAPCHIASLPVALAVQCNSNRRASGSIPA